MVRYCNAACANAEGRCEIGFPFSGVAFCADCPVHPVFFCRARDICGESYPFQRLICDANAEPERQRFNQVCAQEILKNNAYLYGFEKRELDIALKPDIKFQPPGCALHFGPVFVANLANPVPELQFLNDCRNELFRRASVYIWPVSRR